MVSTAGIGTDRDGPVDHLGGTAERRVLWPSERPVGASIRRNNLSRVLALLRHDSPRSRAEIAAATGLTKATVTSLVTDLVERELLRECPVAHTGQSGRPSRPLEVSGQRVAGIGLELEADCLVGVIAGLTGDLVLERHVAIERPPPPDDDATADMLALVDCLLAEAEARQLLVAGACVSVPGVVDQRSEPTFCASRLGWRPADLLPALATGITARFGRPPDLNLEVESNLVALAEARSGGHGSDVNLLCVVGGNGVSAGAIIDGSLRRGASGYLGEVGHMVVDPDGIRCCCGGRGCWQTVVGMPAILQEAAPDLVPGSGDLTVPPQLVRRLVDRAAADDARAVEGLAHVGRWLGVGLASLINILNPSTVVLCGYFRELAPWTLGPALAALHRHGIAPVTGDCQVVTSRVIGSSAALGAAMLASCGVFEDPTTIPK